MEGLRVEEHGKDGRLLRQEGYRGRGLKSTENPGARMPGWGTRGSNAKARASWGLLLLQPRADPAE